MPCGKRLFDARARDVLVLCEEEPNFGVLAARCCRRNGTRREERVMLFLARGVESDWSLIDSHRRDPRVVLAGLANDIASDDYPAMIADAQRVVDLLSR